MEAEDEEVDDEEDDERAADGDGCKRCWRQKFLAWL